MYFHFSFLLRSCK